MDESPLESLSMDRKKMPTPAVPSKNTSLIPEVFKTALIFILVIAVGFLLLDSYRFQQANRIELEKISQKIQALENAAREGISTLKTEISQTQQAVDQVDQRVGSTKAEIRKTAQQIQLEGQKTKAELSEALAAKADTAAVQALKNEADSRIGQVSTEVGGVKTDVVTVKSDLAATRRELEGTQRQLVDVRDTLTAAVAKNSSELEALRRKGDRDFYEFTISKKNLVTKVEDINVVLKKTDPKKGKFTIDVLVDDNRLEKKDRNVNEPLQFLVGKSRLRYELVLNWVDKDRAGGYLSIPKQK